MEESQQITAAHRWRFAFEHRMGRPRIRGRLAIRRGCEKGEGREDQNRDIKNRVQYSRDGADSCSVLLPVPFKALMDHDQFDNASATKCKAHEEERIDKGEVGYFRQARGYRK